jgi:hypothetical protein
MLKALSAISGAVLLRPSFAVAQVADSKAMLVELAKARASIKTLVASFHQRRTLGLLAATVESRGQMTLVRPDRLRWELFAPDAIVYFVGPDGIAYQTPRGRGRASAEAGHPLGAVLGDTLVLLGGDLSLLSARYELSFRREDAKVVVEARPRIPELLRLVRRLELELDRDLAVPVGLVLEESERDRSVIRFEGAVRNAPVDDARMTLG